MQRIIFEIFDKLQMDNWDMKQADSLITAEVNRLMEPYRSRLSAQELEEWRNLIYSVTYTAKKEFFTAGFYFAVRLLLDREL